MENAKSQKDSHSCCQGSCKPGNADSSFTQLIPLDKKLSPEWLQSLYERGEPEIYSGEELQHIGMPIGGICAGQVYLSGDGRLWHWDVFKAYGGTDEEIDPRGLHYAKPITVTSPLDQGFAIKILSDDNARIRRLDASGFTEVTFEGRYPIGHVNYADDDCPVDLTLQAFSPFIPLDENNSGLPVTLMEFTVRNRTDRALSLSIAGWLENKICRYDDEVGKGLRHNDVSVLANTLSLSCSADATADSDPSTLEGYGDMTLALLDSIDADQACAHISGLEEGVSTENAVFEQLIHVSGKQSVVLPFGAKTVGAVGRELELEPGQEQTVRFAISWYFPKYSGGRVYFSTMEDIPNLEELRRHYAKAFDSSQAVIKYLVENYVQLAGTTQLWTDTWYDSTLPYWFLNRTFINTSILATQTCHWFDNDRFYAWEGVDCCPGTCQHVWQYAQSIARLFPGLERSLREHTDYGIAFKSDGSLDYRAEASSHGDELDMVSSSDAEGIFAADGQLGTIIRVYREHSMSVDKAFLSRIWPRVKKSLQFMMTLDTNNDGLLNGPQYHTLDTTWHGEIPWISSLYLAALAAGKKMAEEMGDSSFAEHCNEKLEVGRCSIVEKLFNGEYFIHQPDPNCPESMDLTEGSYIDQVFGQSFVMQLGLERVIPEQESLSALKALWKYNYTPDIGPYRENFQEVKGGRWYAMPGEGGLLMCTWPKEDCNRADFKPTALGLDVTSEGYLNECMSGFEYQVASHMVAEGLVEEGLAVTRTIHDRYHPSKRNPWNEVECSDHYSRAMASYGVFLSACGYDYHGPDGYLSFAPRLTPESFKAPFTASEGWGVFEQKAEKTAQRVKIQLRHGQLKLSKLGVDKILQSLSFTAAVYIDGEERGALFDTDSDRIEVVFENELLIQAGQELTIYITAE
jgi:uncharacterized protein (DUF608 family)